VPADAVDDVEAAKDGDDPNCLFNANLDVNAHHATDIREGVHVDQVAFRALVRNLVALNRSQRLKSSKQARSQVVAVEGKGLSRV
jgi:hypothetical protein